ncbi:MAG: AmmeMemoRadiSam system protein B [DPANN group archaeon]|nr:AmmeMemoRadiSam system protein B [DPANN group archaeon]
MVRKATAAGRFYEDDPEALRGQIRSCFTHPLGPGTLRPSPRQPGRQEVREPVVGAIVPHAGLMFSGMCAAHVYQELAQELAAQEEEPVFLILGVNHTGYGSTSLLLEDFETPLGIAKVDQKLGRHLMEQVGIPDDPLAHRHEHSIEVQLPFLQTIFRKFTFVPLILNEMDGLTELSRKIGDTVASFEQESHKSHRKVIVLASADFTHYGPRYGYVPFTGRVQEQLRQLDQGAIDTILRMDPDAFIGYLRKTEATICGALTIPSLLTILDRRTQGTGKHIVPKLLKYYTSGDLLQDHENTVSYASIVFRETREA